MLSPLNLARDRPPSRRCPTGQGSRTSFANHVYSRLSSLSCSGGPVLWKVLHPGPERARNMGTHFTVTRQLRHDQGQNYPFAPRGDDIGPAGPGIANLSNRRPAHRSANWPGHAITSQDQSFAATARITARTVTGPSVQGSDIDWLGLGPVRHSSSAAALGQCLMNAGETAAALTLSASLVDKVAAATASVLRSVCC